MVDADGFGRRIGCDLHGAVGDTARRPVPIQGRDQIDAIRKFSECGFVHTKPSCDHLCYAVISFSLADIRPGSRLRGARSSAFSDTHRRQAHK